MRLRAFYRWLSTQLICVAMHVSPCERDEWTQAMSREVDEIPSEREALRWALGCVQVSCRERLKSMRLTNRWLVRWGMALWIVFLAIDTLAYAGITLTYKLQAWRAIPMLGLLKEHYHWNVPLLEVTPIWEPMLALVEGVVFLLAIVLILRCSRLALWAAVTPFAIMLLLFAVRLSRPESGYLQSLSIAYQRSHFALIWPITGLAITILICLALWRDSRTPAPR
jgi:hypothetical protein